MAIFFLLKKIKRFTYAFQQLYPLKNNGRQYYIKARIYATMLNLSITICKFVDFLHKYKKKLDHLILQFINIIGSNKYLCPYY